MARTKKRTKKTPQPRRKSSRCKKRTKKGEYYDEYLLETEVTSGVTDERTNSEACTIATGDKPRDEETLVEVQAEKCTSIEKISYDLSQSTPSVILADTPRRKSSTRSEGTDLKTLITVSDVVGDMVESVSYEFPESVVTVDANLVKEINF